MKGLILLHFFKQPGISKLIEINVLEVIYHFQSFKLLVFLIKLSVKTEACNAPRPRRMPTKYLKALSKLARHIIHWFFQSILPVRGFRYPLPVYFNRPILQSMNSINVLNADKSPRVDAKINKRNEGHMNMNNFIITE